VLLRRDSRALLVHDCGEVEEVALITALALAAKGLGTALFVLEMSADE
jgi:hypothetical protein